VVCLVDLMGVVRSGAGSAGIVSPRTSTHEKGSSLPIQWCRRFLTQSEDCRTVFAQCRGVLRAIVSQFRRAKPLTCFKFRFL